MKGKWILLLLPELIFSRCTVTNYYQLFTAQPENGVKNTANISFEDDNLLISYNLWGIGGDFSFSVYNKSQEDVVVQMDKSFFVLNGYAYDYFKNRVYTQKTNSVPLNPANISITFSDYSISYSERPDVVIPPLTKKYFSEYTINNNYYENCDLPKFPRAKKNKSISFTKDNSPFVFYNLITYVHNGISKRFENHFFVSEIINLPQNAMIKLEEVRYCNKKTGQVKQVFIHASPDKFFVPYMKIKSSSKK